MSSRIGHSSINENGQISGGQAGDQTTKEVYIRSWYNKPPWPILLRPTTKEIAEKSAQACEAGCANDKIGYDQPYRNTLHTQAQKVGYDLSKVTTPCSCDCSSFMTICAIAGGVTELEYPVNSNAPTTSTMVDKFTKTGKYQKITDSQILNSEDYQQRGDILVRPGSHTVMVLDNGSKVKTSLFDKIKKNLPLPANRVSYPMRGVDVAAWQVGVDYKKLKDNGVQFAIIKVIRKDLQPDKMFETHYNGFLNAGVPILGCYNYSYATTVEKARTDANAVLKVLNGRKMTVFFDTEDQCQQGIGHRLIDIINTYQEVIESAGLPFAIYSGLSYTKSFLSPYLNDLKCKDIWMARYYNGYATMYINSPLNESKKPLVDGFNFLGWQYTSSGKIDGYNSNIDMSIMYQPVSNNKPQIITNPEPIKAGYCTAHALKVRSLPSMDGKVLGYVTQNTKVLIYDEQNGWYKITPRDDENKWVSSKYIQLI